MKKSWIVLAMMAALCAACNEGDIKQSCVENSAICGSDGVRMVCTAGEYVAIPCGIGTYCSGAGKCLTPSSYECSGNTVPSCTLDPVTNKPAVAYCSQGHHLLEVCPDGWTCGSKHDTYYACGNKMCANGQSCDVFCNSQIPGTKAYCSLYGDMRCDVTDLTGLAAQPEIAVATCIAPTSSDACTTGETRCNLDGGHETCVAGVWTSTACAPEKQCIEGKCVGCTNGDRKCGPNGEVQKCVNETWSTVAVCKMNESCLAGSCETFVEYCGDKMVNYGDQEMTLQEACDQEGDNLIGICEGDHVDCANPCDIASAGQDVRMCSVFTFTIGQTAPIEVSAKCIALDDTHAIAQMIDDESGDKYCANACNAQGTLCDQDGYSDEPNFSESESNITWCGDEMVRLTDDGSSMKLQDACDQIFGDNHVGVCVDDEVDCFERCTATDAGQAEPYCSEFSLKTSSAFVEVIRECIDLGESHFGYEINYSSAKLCKAQCNDENTACDSDGYETSPVSSNGYFKCGNKFYDQAHTTTLQQHCDSDIPGSTAVCITLASGTYFACAPSCSSKGTTGSVCSGSIPDAYSFPTICDDVEGSLLMIDNAEDVEDYKDCNNGCNSAHTACK